MQNTNCRPVCILQLYFFSNKLRVHSHLLMTHNAYPVSGASGEFATPLAHPEPAGPARRPPVDDPAELRAAPGAGPGRRRRRRRLDIGRPVQRSTVADADHRPDVGLLPQREQFGPEEPWRGDFFLFRLFAGFRSGGWVVGDLVVDGGVGGLIDAQGVLIQIDFGAMVRVFIVSCV